MSVFVTLSTVLLLAWGAWAIWHVEQDSKDHYGDNEWSGQNDE